MSKLLRIGLVVTALIATGIVARSAVLSSISGTDTLAVTSGTLANDVPVSVLATYIGSNAGDQNIGTGVNKVSITGGATTVGPRLSVGGTSSDTNIGIILAGKGTGAAHLGGTTLANASVRVPTIASAVNQVQLEGAVTGSPILIHPGGSGVDTNTGVDIYGNGTGPVLIGGNTTTLAGLQVAQTASRVNDIVITPTATGTTPIIGSGGAGADANIGLNVLANGTGTVVLGSNGGGAAVLIPTVASLVDYLQLAGAATANPATVTTSANGTDTNINLAVTPKGSGVVKVGGTIATCTGTTTATCQGQRFVASVTGLTTAASTLAATMTVTDASVVSSSSIVVCQAQGYAGTGVPVVVNVTPGTGSVAFGIQNVSTGAALNATVAVGCFVFGT